MKKSAIDVSDGVVRTQCNLEDVPHEWSDYLRPAKLKIMEFAQHALRSRSELNKQALLDYVNLDTSDWRSREWNIKCIGGARLSCHRSDQVASTVTSLIFGKRWNTPVPSKFRGCWESAVEHLLQFCIHQIGRTFKADRMKHHRPQSSRDPIQSLAEAYPNGSCFGLAIELASSFASQHFSVLKCRSIYGAGKIWHRYCRISSNPVI